jgi:enamine deaminase RidA (YjgF/YER057c/UK114 family)
MRMLSPPAIRPPFARYAHGVEVPPGARLVVTSGQLGLTADDHVPEGAEAQAALCFANGAAILAEAGMGPADVIRINAFVTGPGAYGGLYGRARRLACGGSRGFRPPPLSSCRASPGPSSGGGGADRRTPMNAGI